MALADLCGKVLRGDVKAEIIAVCDATMAERFGDALEAKGCRIAMLDDGSVSAVQSQERQSFLARLYASFRSTAGNGRGSILARVVFNFLLNTSIVQYLRERRITKRIALSKAQAGALLELAKPDVVLSISDRSQDYVESGILWAARKRNIKIVIPYVAHFDADAAIFNRQDEKGRLQPEFNPLWPFSLYKFAAYFRFRKQTYRNALFQAAFVLNAHRKSGTLSSYPWCIGNGICDVVCVNSQQTEERYVSRCVPAEKIHIVGDVYYDDVSNSLSQKDYLEPALRKKYALNPDKKIIVLAMPQYAEQGVLNWKDHWGEIDRVLQSTIETGHNVLISLHPRMDPQDYAFLESKYPCHIAEERLAEFLPIGDVFVALYSTTIIWAVLCGIPSVIMDFHKLSGDIADDLHTLSIVTEHSALKSTIEKTLTDNTVDFRPDWRALSRNDIFDGKTVQRYRDLFYP